ncbi:MAG: thiamine-binding protein [Proteobacteria bacterium]|nr:thiamine-binding protein [Pseudomonadota bacterium]
MIGITAQISLYGLRQDDLSPSVDAAVSALKQHGVETQTGAMSTLVWGDDEVVFPALMDAFRQAAMIGETVMVLTVSNACPWPGGKKE